MNKIYYPLLLLGGFLLAWGTYHALGGSPTFGGTGSGSQADACTVFTVSSVTIGNQQSTQILSSHANRAFATLQQPINATNTVNVSFATGTAATLTSGLQLPAATSTSPSPSLTFGLATDKPYTGAVTAITNVASTTLLVTECLY